MTRLRHREVQQPAQPSAESGTRHSSALQRGLPYCVGAAPRQWQISDLKVLGHDELLKVLEPNSNLDGSKEPVEPGTSLIPSPLFIVPL